ncbi:MAG: hypothetical protein D3910_17035 [Candidatus Electrothrix sp. ATG2]|nr:hypothetical protein [Candidatus Electrothrix sp. ATG2]
MERIYKTIKTDQGWTDTVNRMVSFDTPNISESQGKQVLNYLISQQKRRDELTAEDTGKEKIGKKLVEQKCSFCHGLDKVYIAEKTPEEWGKTIDKMAAYSDQEEFLSSHEKEAVIEFLSSRGFPDAEKEK